MNLLVSAFTKNKGILKLNDKNLDLRQPHIQNGVKDYIVNIFNNIGIGIDRDTINYML